MNNKPVSKYKAITNTKIEPTVVSYTHPVKELTDEEAFEIFADEAMKGGNYDWKAGVRAILRKAQSTCNGFCGEYECKENQAICKRKAQEK